MIIEYISVANYKSQFIKIGDNGFLHEQSCRFSVFHKKLLLVISPVISFREFAQCNNISARYACAVAFISNPVFRRLGFCNVYAINKVHICVNAEKKRDYSTFIFAASKLMTPTAVERTESKEPNTYWDVSSLKFLTGLFLPYWQDLRLISHSFAFASFLPVMYVLMMTYSHPDLIKASCQPGVTFFFNCAPV